MKLRSLARSAAWLATGVGIGAGVVGAVGAWSLSGPRRVFPSYDYTPFEVQVAADTVSFTASDGVRIGGWWLDQPDSPDVVICCHGHRGSKSDMLGIGPGLYRNGHTVLLFDFRGSADSEDGNLSLAHYEQRDLTAAIDYVKSRRPDARIAVVAFSMGAATSILTAAKDDRIEALVLDSPFASLADVVGSTLRRYKLPARLLVPVIDLATRIGHGYRLEDVRPIDAIAKLAPRPVLLLHGTDDVVIPYRHALELAKAAGEGAVELVTFDGLPHCGGYFADRDGYIARVHGFLTRWLNS